MAQVGCDHSIRYGHVEPHAQYVDLMEDAYCLYEDIDYMNGKMCSTTGDLLCCGEVASLNFSFREYNDRLHMGLRALWLGGVPNHTGPGWQLHDGAGGLLRRAVAGRRAVIPRSSNP